jgi:hypothetical protein
MIYKNPECRELEKLCIAHLFKAEFNLLIRLLLGQWAMYQRRDLFTKANFADPQENATMQLCWKSYITILHRSHRPQLEAIWVQCYCMLWPHHDAFCLTLFNCHWHPQVLMQNVGAHTPSYHPLDMYRIWRLYWTLLCFDTQAMHRRSWIRRVQGRLC